jgi:hypothetical protein
MAGCNTKRMKAGGPTGMHKMPDGTMMKGAKHGYKAGGLAMVEKGGKKVPFYAADGVGKMNMGGKVMKYKAGGCVKGDGICKKGRTKGRMV